MATKRDASNPLMAAAAKKAKKDVASTSKRKYTEETPGGLLIVRAPRNDAQSRERQPTAGPSEPPPAAKKFKADTSSRGLSVPANRTRTASVDPIVEKDVREMEDEADRLRRASRAHTIIDPSLASTSMSFRPTSPEKPPPKPKPKAAKGKKDKGVRVVDTQVPILDGTPQAERNKLLRGDAMAAIARDRERGRTPEADQEPKGHSRRSSLGGRGKRISSSFQAGAFTLPHPKVHEESFYKHIDRELPDAEQLRQLLTWSASRASTSAVAELPPEDAAGLEGIKDGMVRMLAERRIDLSLFGPEDEEDMAAKGTNAQNEKNRQWEVVYTKQLQDAQDEDEEWKKTKYFYEAHAVKEQKRLAERRSSRSSSSSPLPDPALLSDRLRHGLRLAQAPSPSPASTQIRARLPELQWKFDLLHANLNSARTCARVAGRALDARFGLLGEGLAGRAGDPHVTATALAGPSGVGGAPAHTHDLLRALTRVDMARPPGMVGDAARRAAREVERATRAGEGERRLTLTGAAGGSGSGAGAGGGGGTPRRPGTPRRERERTPGGRERERTPGR
ncbi:Mis12-Mtw1 protein family-domain-containing protein [Mycena filopes]|nr:Mis12-Mtw1 protein family-domain-containing protein [Mycena filopes]